MNLLKTTFVSLASADFEPLINHEIRVNTELSEDEQNVAIRIFDNDKFEGDKVFTVQLSVLESDFENLSIEPSSIQILIQDDETPPERSKTHMFL